MMSYKRLPSCYKKILISRNQPAQHFLNLYSKWNSYVWKCKDLCEPFQIILVIEVFLTANYAQLLCFLTTLSALHFSLVNLDNVCSQLTLHSNRSYSTNICKVLKKNTCSMRVRDTFNFNCCSIHSISERVKKNTY